MCNKLTMLGAPVILLGALALTGCTLHWYAKATCTYRPGSPRVCTAEAGAYGTIPLNVNGVNSIPEVASVTTVPTSIYVDFTGTNFPLDSNGMALITLKNNHGNIIAAKSFAWYRNGMKALLENPVAMQSWAGQYPTATAINASLDTGPAPTDGKQHTYATAYYVNGTRVASDVSTFTAPCILKGNSPYLCTPY